MGTQRDHSSEQSSQGIERFTGTWILISSITDGKHAAEAEIRNVRVVISGGMENVWVGDQEVAHEIPFTVDLSIVPHQTTDYLPGGHVIRGITKVEGELLTSCVAPVDAERPAEFASTAGSGHILRVFKRLSR